MLSVFKSAPTITLPSQCSRNTREYANTQKQSEQNVFKGDTDQFVTHETTEKYVGHGFKKWVYFLVYLFSLTATTFSYLAATMQDDT